MKDEKEIGIIPPAHPLFDWQTLERMEQRLGMGKPRILEAALLLMWVMLPKEMLENARRRILAKEILGMETDIEQTVLDTFAIQIDSILHSMLREGIIDTRRGEEALRKMMASGPRGQVELILRRVHAKFGGTEE